MISKKSMTCWKVFKSDRLTVLRPASVMALTQRNRESVKLTLLAGVEAPQKMTADTRHVMKKYA